MARIRALLRDATHCATTAGYGPRFLHSTGQLHKGGPPTGWFLQLTADHPHDRPIPGWPYTFGRLIDAQAEGDFAAIESHDLPILRVHLADPERGLIALERSCARRSRTAAARASAPIDAGRTIDGRRIAMRIGFIGLGRMGANMVRRLLRDGHEVVAYNRTPEKTTEIAGEGAIAALHDRRAGREAREAARGLDHGPRRRRDRGPDRGADGAPRAGRHDHRRRQHELPRRPAPPRRARRRRASTTSTPARRGGIWGLQVGYCLMVGGERRAR